MTLHATPFTPTIFQPAKAQKRKDKTNAAAIPAVNNYCLNSPHLHPAQNNNQQPFRLKRLAAGSLKQQRCRSPQSFSEAGHFFPKGVHAMAIFEVTRTGLELPHGERFTTSDSPVAAGNLCLFRVGPHLIIGRWFPGWIIQPGRWIKITGEVVIKKLSR